MANMDDLAHRLAEWAATYTPTPADRSLADLALVDTVSVALAARGEPILATVAELSPVERWAAAAHILDFDDLHLPSTTHISAVCVPAALGTGGGAEAYLVGAGVMARLGTVLGHGHYTRGWHATATAGTVAAAAAAGQAYGLDAGGLARAMALAIASAGGVQAAFGTDGKSLQVGMCAGAGIRAARLADLGASAATGALDDWVRLLGGDPSGAVVSGDAIPGGLAVKLFPCCYALQRPIGAMAALAHGDEGASVRVDGSLTAEEVDKVVVRTPLQTVKPLIHARPSTGLEGKFSLEYALVAAVLDPYPGFASFTDDSVRRPAAQELLRRVEVITTADDGEGLLAGEVEIELHTARGIATSRLSAPPGSPANPATTADLDAKFIACLAGSGVGPDDIRWETAAELLERLWPVADVSAEPSTKGS